MPISVMVGLQNNAPNYTDNEMEIMPSFSLHVMVLTMNNLGQMLPPFGGKNYIPKKHHHCS